MLRRIDSWVALGSLGSGMVRGATRALSALALATGLLLGSASVGVAQDGETVKLGGLFPLSGGLQAYGEESLKGAQIAVNEANKAGGLLGRQVELRVGDTQTTPQGGIEAANRLINLDKVVGIIGPMASSVTLPVALSVAKSSKVAMISPSATAPTITEAADDDFLFRVAPSDALQGEVLAEVVWRQKITRVAVMYQNDDYGVGLAEAFKKAFLALGGTFDGAAYEPKQASYRSELRALARGGAAHLLLIAFPDNGGITVLRQSLEEGYFKNFIMTDGMKTEALFSGVGKNVLDGSFGTAPRAVESDASAYFGKAYQTTFGKLPPQPFIDTSYDAAMIFMLAAVSAKSLDPVKIRDHIRLVTTAESGAEIVGPGQFTKAVEILNKGGRVNYNGASGEISFTPKGDVNGTYEVWEVTNGAIQTARLIYPS